MSHGPKPQPSHFMAGLSVWPVPTLNNKGSEVFSSGAETDQISLWAKLIISSQKHYEFVIGREQPDRAATTGAGPWGLVSHRGLELQWDHL